MKFIIGTWEKPLGTYGSRSKRPTGVWKKPRELMVSWENDHTAGLTNERKPAKVTENLTKEHIKKYIQ